MLDPRIYRMGIVPVLLAVIVLAFSLEDQPGPLSTTIVPDAFNGAQAYATMKALARSYPSRPAGSIADGQPGQPGLAGYIARRLHHDRFKVSIDSFRGPTPAGTRTMENVIGVLAGGRSGSIVVVSNRDATGPPSVTGLSGTAVMLQLASVLSGQTLNRTLVLVSTTGSDGAVGTERVISQLPGPIDAVLVLGDLAGVGTRQPIVVPWSDAQNVSPPILRNTLTSALSAQTGLTAESSGLAGQVAHLAFPMTVGEQAPLVSSGVPAVLLSLSGERPPSPREAPSPSRMIGTGRAALQALSALENGPSVGSPSTYLQWAGKVIPAWAVRLLVLVLILPVLAVTVDGMARARRRGHPIARWLVWVGASAVPFVLAALLVIIAGATGWIGPAPGTPVNPGTWPLGTGGTVLLAVMALLILAGLLWLRPVVIRLVGLRGRLTAPSGPPHSEMPASPRPNGVMPAAARPNGAMPAAARRERDDPAGRSSGAAAAVLLVMCVVALAVWVSNPFAALLVVPALHLWLWVVTPDVRLPLPVTVLLLLVGLAPVGLLATYVALTLGLGPVALVWTGALLLAGGGLSVLGTIEWCLLAGCAISTVVIALRAQTQPREVPISVRGPVSYAGPGSLGGTGSALRR